MRSAKFQLIIAIVAIALTFIAVQYTGCKKGQFAVFKTSGR
jgi:hypothetical protein